MEQFMSPTTPDNQESPSGKSAEQKVEESKQSLPLPSFTKLKEVAEIASKFIFALTGLCYVAGLLIVNLHLREYGNFHLGFAQIDYIMVGALWMVLAVSGYLLLNETIYSLRKNLPKVINKNTNKKERFEALLRIASSLVIRCSGKV